MLRHTLPYNPILTAMTYDSSKEELVLTYKRTNEKRNYNASIEVAYKLFYCKNAAECLNVFNKLIKNKLRILTIDK